MRWSILSQYSTNPLPLQKKNTKKHLLSLTLVVHVTTVVDTVCKCCTTCSLSTQPEQLVCVVCNNICWYLIPLLSLTHTTTLSLCKETHFGMCALIVSSALKLNRDHPTYM